MKTGARIIPLNCGYARYVALKSATDLTVVAHGNNLRTVINKTRKAGVRRPFLVFPLDPKKRYIF